MVGDARGATNAYAVGTSLDERCSWWGTRDHSYLTDNCGWYCSVLKNLQFVVTQTMVGYAAMQVLYVKP